MYINSYCYLTFEQKVIVLRTDEKQRSNDINIKCSCAKASIIPPSKNTSPMCEKHNINEETSVGLNKNHNR